MTTTFATTPGFDLRLYDLSRLLTEAGFPHRPDVDRYLISTISKVVSGLCN